MAAAAAASISDIQKFKILTVDPGPICVIMLNFITIG